MQISVLLIREAATFVENWFKTAVFILGICSRSPLQIFQQVHFDNIRVCLPASCSWKKLQIWLSKCFWVSREALQGLSKLHQSPTLGFLLAHSALPRCLSNMKHKPQEYRGGVQAVSVWLKETQIVWKNTSQMILTDVIWWLAWPLLLCNYESRTGCLLTSVNTVMYVQMMLVNINHLNSKMVFLFYKYTRVKNFHISI